MEVSGKSGGKVILADEAHFRADTELEAKWVLRGEQTMVDSTSPSYSEKARYCSAVCRETGEMELTELQGNGNSGTTVAYLKQLR